MALSYSDKLTKVTDLKVDSEGPVGVRDLLGLTPITESTEDAASLMRLSLLADTVLGTSNNNDPRLVAVKGLYSEINYIKLNISPDNKGPQGITGPDGPLGPRGYQGTSGGIQSVTTYAAGSYSSGSTETGWAFIDALYELGFDIDHVTVFSNKPYFSNVILREAVTVNSVQSTNGFFHSST